MAWNRYAYANNNPIRYSDPSGHCVLLCVALLGAAIGAGINIVSQYQETGSFESINWKEVAVSGAIGAVAGVVGAAIIAPAAAVAGASVTAATGSALIGTTAELTLGGFMAGTANVLLNNTQRTATHLIRDEKVTLKSIESEFRTNYWSDMGYGAAGFGIGKAFSAIGSKFWSPSDAVSNPPVFGEPILSAPTGGSGHLLNPHPAQKIVTGAASAFAQSVSNSSLLEFWHKNRHIAE